MPGCVMAGNRGRTDGGLGGDSHLPCGDLLMVFVKSR